jgi:hypothetical protein
LSEAFNLQSIKLRSVKAVEPALGNYIPIHHAAAAFTLFVGVLGDLGFGREHVAGDRGCVLESVTRDLGGIDDAGCDKIFELLGRGVEPVCSFTFGDLADDEFARASGI